LLEKETDPENRWQRLCEVHRELSQLRRDDHRAVRTHIKRQRWRRETEREEENDLERTKREERKRLRSICFSELKKKSMAGLFGGGEQGERMAELLHRIEFDLPLDDLDVPKPSANPHSNGIKPDQIESDPIQPDPANFSNGHAPAAEST
jgi:hypothetical protein